MLWKRKQQDFKSEIDAHLQLEADELRSEGLTAGEAEAAARRALGNRTAVEERFYESSHWMFAEHLLRDLRHAARVLSKDLKFSVLAILGLSLGIGISTAIFALIDGSFRLGDRAVAQDSASYVGLLNRARDTDLSYSDYRYYREHATAFTGMNAESGRWRFIMNPVSGGAEAEEREGRFESADFLSVIGLHPTMGPEFFERRRTSGRSAGGRAEPSVLAAAVRRRSECPGQDDRAQ
jgi:hypothetical protein